MIVITLEGGLVSSVRSDDPAVVGKEVVINDYDAEGSDDYVTDSQGDDCCPRRETIEALAPKVADEIEALVRARENLG